METKKKLVSVFEKLIENAKIEDLSRTKEILDVNDFQTKCMKRMDSCLECIPTGCNCSANFSKNRSCFIKPKNSEDCIQIFPVKVEYTSSFSDYNSKKEGFTFFQKRENSKSFIIYI
jgi:hypothetical protein